MAAPACRLLKGWRSFDGRLGSRRGVDTRADSGRPLLDNHAARPKLLASSTGQKGPAMERQQWSLQDAKNSFSAVVEAALRGKPQTVTKRGKPAVIVLSIAEYERLARKAAPATPSFVEHLLSMPQDDLEFERIPLDPRDVDF